MAYSESIQKLKDMLDGYSAESGRIETLYKSAIENAEANRKASLDALDKQYYADRNEAYADTAREERNTMNMLAARGLGFSGEAAQAKLNSNVLLSERLGALTRGKENAKNEIDLALNEQKHSLALDAAERQSALDKNRTNLAADIAKMELDSEQEQARIKAEKDMQKAELAAKYGNSGQNSGSGSGSSSGNSSASGGNINIGVGGDGIIGFDPEASPKELAKLLVTSATDDGYIRSDYDEYLINRYMLQLYDNYTLPDGYMDELVFMLKAYGYPAGSRSEMRIQVISREAKEYYENSYASRYDGAVMDGKHELSAGAFASLTARNDALDYIYSRTENETEFKTVCANVGIPENEVSAYIESKRPPKQDNAPDIPNLPANHKNVAGKPLTHNSLK